MSPQQQHWTYQCKEETLRLSTRPSETVWQSWTMHSWLEQFLPFIFLYQWRWLQFSCTKCYFYSFPLLKSQNWCQPYFSELAPAKTPATGGDLYSQKWTELNSFWIKAWGYINGTRYKLLRNFKGWPRASLKEDLAPPPPSTSVADLAEEGMWGPLWLQRQMEVSHVSSKENPRHSQASSCLLWAASYSIMTQCDSITQTGSLHLLHPLLQKRKPAELFSSSHTLKK